MPVRSLSSSVIAWPRKNTVESALRVWAQDLAKHASGLLAVGYFGSYARGDWGVGSDLDLIVVIERSETPFGSRVIDQGTSILPVPTDIFVYTRSELTEMLALGGRFASMLRREAIWVWPREGFPEREG
jgi:predicted nucleotidyltransferase